MSNSKTPESKVIGAPAAPKISRTVAVKGKEAQKLADGKKMIDIREKYRTESPEPVEEEYGLARHTAAVDKTATGKEVHSRLKTVIDTDSYKQTLGDHKFKGVKPKKMMGKSKPKPPPKKPRPKAKAAAKSPETSPTTNDTVNLQYRNENYCFIPIQFTFQCCWKSFFDASILCH